MAYPALKQYCATRALIQIRDAHAAGDPNANRLAPLVESCCVPMLFEGGFEGMNIVVLHDYVYFAIPRGEGPFSYERVTRNGYSRSYEAESPEVLKDLILRHRHRPVHEHVVNKSRSSTPPPLRRVVNRGLKPPAAVNPIVTEERLDRYGSLASSLERATSEIATLERRIHAAESDLAEIHQSRTWRTLIRLGGLLQGPRKSPRPGNPA